MTRLASEQARYDRHPAHSLTFLSLVAAITLSACGGTSQSPSPMAAAPSPTALRPLRVTAPTPDPRIGLRPGLFNAGQAAWNLRLVSTTPPAEQFVGVTNSDLAFKGNYAIQGNYNGIQVWDVSNPSRPTSVVTYVCPASQSDVSVYGDLLFVSGEGLGGRLDCGAQGVEEAISHDRLRGIRIFDITNIRDPKYVANVQTCRGSHTHTVLEHPGDRDNVYIYVSGSSSVRPEEELPGCSALSPSEDPNSALFRIEVIRVPLAHPEQAAIVSSPRIFNDLVAPPQHGLAPADLAEIEAARRSGGFVVGEGDRARVISERRYGPVLDSIREARGGRGTPSAADSAALRSLLEERFGRGRPTPGDGPAPGPTQCHDITVYPSIGYAGGACGGYGLLLDIENPTDPRRMAAVSDSNFSYWHSATFNNDGTKVLFTDEWGGGGAPKCRDTDPVEWGADAIFTLRGTRMEFQSYYKLPVAQTSLENCVAHNGSLIPIPGRDVMVQGWYQGGISVFDWTDPKHAVEIAFFDRGPVDAERMRSGGSWSVYWYNGVIVSSEIARGLDILELVPSEAISQNEIEAARSVRLDHLNSQGQPKFVWPHTFALARAYVDQLERSGAMAAGRVAAVRRTLSDAESRSGSSRASTLGSLARELSDEAGRSLDGAKVRALADAVRGLAQGG